MNVLILYHIVNLAIKVSTSTQDFVAFIRKRINQFNKELRHIFKQNCFGGSLM